MDSSRGYRIRRKLGFGGGGIVFSGIRKSDNLRVAIKIIKGKGLKRTTSDVYGRPFRKFHGTLVHSPPEWFNSWEFAQETWTVWSLGVLVFTLICGNYPFKEKEVTYANPFSNPLWDILEEKGKELQNLVYQCLAFNPLKRISLSQILQSPWMQYK